MSNPYLQQLRELDQKLQLEPIEQFDAQLSHLFEVVPSAVMFQDLLGRVVLSNSRACDLLGFNPDGKMIKDVFKDTERRGNLGSQVVLTGIPKRGELHEYTRDDGTRFWLLTDRIPHHGSFGHIDGVLIFSVDVTSVVERS